MELGSEGDHESGYCCLPSQAVSLEKCTLDPEESILGCCFSYRRKRSTMLIEKCIGHSWLPQVPIYGSGAVQGCNLCQEGVGLQSGMSKSYNRCGNGQTLVLPVRSPTAPLLGQL